jgi:hypothetical protein
MESRQSWGWAWSAHSKPRLAPGLSMVGRVLKMNSRRVIGFASLCERPSDDKRGGARFFPPPCNPLEQCARRGEEIRAGKSGTRIGTGPVKTGWDKTARLSVGCA